MRWLAGSLRCGLERAVSLAAWPWWRARYRRAAERGDAAATERARQRYLTYLRRGFDGLRDAWWLPLSMERWWNFLRHVLLIEWYALENIGRTQTPGVGTSTPRRCLVVQFGHLGDMVQTAPALRALKDHDADADVDLLTGPWSVGVAEMTDLADHVYGYSPSFEQFRRGDARGRRSIRQEIHFLDELRHRRYDTVILAGNESMTHLLLAMALAPLRLVGAIGEQACYDVPGQMHARGYAWNQPEYRRILRLLEPLGIRKGGASLDCFPVRRGENDVAGLPEGPGPLVVMAPGAGWPGKIWPIDRFGELGRRLATERGARIVLVGTAAEADLTGPIASAVGARAVDLAGNTDLDRLIALLRRAHLFIGNDSGPLHVAAAVGCKTVSLFGPTPPAQWAPQGRGHRAVRAVEGCPDCIPWHPRAACVNENHCMKAVTIEMVADAVREVLGEA